MINMTPLTESLRGLKDQFKKNGEDTMEKNFTRINGNRWCSVNLKLDNGRFSVSGSEGEVVTVEQAKTMALEYWEGFFDDDPEQLANMNKRFSKCFRSSKLAAKFVIDTDGEYHGLDVDREEDGKVYLVQSCGQIREAIAEFFPEVSCLFPYHLNDMKADCEHQQASKAHGLEHEKNCRICGYSYGSAWLKNDLSQDVVAYVESLNL